ncbi:hypothetical protein [Sinorhizobium mexicanum]|uniref:Uncharacterized protein n=1 Tax=Sinorhizobium mexicanum TaxID=375549 RepID=A0A859QFL1_9HYPH|nr:hypothetical protein [Sinorhizobium mexicanum]MBP1883236.1 hypothetical protein [Sinorhizobium mexicanum]QLL62444.1 hypothetical protein FKV68_13860 [Sinorhizobium mexicanum]
MEMNAEAWIAIYAAIVATGALFLEIRRWVESGPKLYISAKANMVMLDGIGNKTEGLLVVNATNRGDAPTTITNLCLLRYPSWFSRLRKKADKSFVIPHPQAKGSTSYALPYVLSPGQQWIGMAHDRQDATGDIQTGRFWVALYTTDRNAPYVVHIPKRSANSELSAAKPLMRH